MHRFSNVSLIVLIGISLSAQTVNITGKVTNLSGKGISGAVVTLLSKKLSATTDASGAYSLSGTAILSASALPGIKAISLHKGALLVSLTRPAPVQIESFDIHGNLLEKAIEKSAPAGTYRFDLMKQPLAMNMMVIRVCIGGQSVSFRYFPLQSGKRTFGLRAASSAGIAKKLAIQDTLQASATRYVTKRVAITSYDGTVDIALDTSNCTTTPPTKVNVTFSGKAFGGSHEVVVETDPGLPKFTIFRPKDLAPGKKYPIIAWGQGGCSTNGLSNPEFNGEFASWGYLSIADGTPNNGAGGGCGTSAQMDLKSGKCLLDAIHWAIKENSNPCSQYYQSLDTTNTAAFGWSCGGIMSEGAGSMKDPVLTTFMLNSSGQTSANQATIDAFQKPVLFLLGGSGDMAYANGKRDYEAIKTGAVPAMLVSTGVGHGGTYTQDNGGSFAQVDLAWLNWWLKGDLGATGKGYLVGSTCSICTNSAWEVMSKNLP